MWHFSEHILKRIKDRSIPKSDVLAIVNNEVSILIVPSNRDKSIDLYFGKIKDKYFLVVANRETRNLITVRKMRNKEKLLFDQEASDGKK